MHRVFFASSSSRSPARQRKRASGRGTRRRRRRPIKVDVIDPNAAFRSGAAARRSTRRSSRSISTRSPTRPSAGGQADPALLVALREAPPCPSEREPDKLYLSAPAAPKK
jgi:hypothetical protein